MTAILCVSVLLFLSLYAEPRFFSGSGPDLAGDSLYGDEGFLQRDRATPPKMVADGFGITVGGLRNEKRSHCRTCNPFGPETRTSVLHCSCSVSVWTAVTRHRVCSLLQAR